jgi:hypothetical protein
VGGCGNRCATAKKTSGLWREPDCRRAETRTPIAGVVAPDDHTGDRIMVRELRAPFGRDREAFIAPAKDVTSKARALPISPPRILTHQCSLDFVWQCLDVARPAAMKYMRSLQ